MKALTFFVVISFLPSLGISSGCDDIVNPVDRYECKSNRRDGVQGKRDTVGENKFLVPLVDTVTTLSINGEDTTKTITIKKTENWGESQRDFKRFVDMYQILGAISILGTGILTIIVLVK